MQINDSTVALVTGGASGLGGATVRRLHAEGAAVVIVDLPSLKMTADARAISPCVDGVIMVAEAGKTPTDILGEAMQDLASARANILGVVLNKVDERPLRKHGNLAAAYYT